jgi:hypothetical protein
VPSLLGGVGGFTPGMVPTTVRLEPVHRAIRKVPLLFPRSAITSLECADYLGWGRRIRAVPAGATRNFVTTPGCLWSLLHPMAVHPNDAPIVAARRTSFVSSTSAMTRPPERTINADVGDPFAIAATTAALALGWCQCKKCRAPLLSRSS